MVVAAMVIVAPLMMSQRDQRDERHEEVACFHHVLKSLQDLLSLTAQLLGK